MTEHQPARPAELGARHPGLRDVMDRSPNFRTIKQNAALEIDDRVEYIVRGDTVGDECDLLVEALVRGAASNEPSDVYRALYMEVDEDTRAAIASRIRT